MRERGILLALLTGMGAVTYRSAGSNAGKPAPSVQIAETANRQVYSSEEELGKTFEDFDKRRTFQIASGPAGASLTVKPIPNLHRDGDLLAFDWVIAVVPDPEHSNLKLDFDRDIEAIQLAAAKTAYQFERYWLPWRAEAAPPKESSYVIRRALAFNHLATDEAAVDPREDNREGLPGVLLFRNSGSQPLAIFLVSESPTAGIAPREFRTAVYLGRKLASLEGQRDDGHLRLIGPGLSGSLDSLSTLINTQPNPSFAEIFVRTWTTDRASHERFRASVGDGATDDMKYCPREGEAHFKPMEADTIQAIRAFIDHVRTKWHDGGPIVLLTEEVTTFGAVKKLTFGKGDAPIYQIPFPRNLSRLRNASEKQDHVPGFDDGSRRSEIPRNGLFMSLKQEGGANLEMPAFSKEQTPLSQESVLFTIGGMLKTGSFHYVGIIATDPLDTLFLTRYLHSAAPNVRIFTTSPDLMFEHGSDSSDYSGIMSVSTYPLFPLSQVWSGARTGVNAFPAQTSEAVYNSTLEILPNVPHAPPEGKRGAAEARRDGINPFTFSKKPAWITVAGGSGFEPIAIVDPHQDIETASESVRDRRFPAEYWPGWGYAFCLVLSAGLAFCALLLFALSDGPRAFAIFASRPENQGDPLPRAFYLFAMGACLAVLASIWLVVPGVVLYFNTPPTGYFRLEGSAVQLFVSGSIAFTAFQLWLARRRAASKALPADPSSPKAPLIDAPAAVVVCGCLLFSAAPFFMRSPVGYPTPILSHLWSFYCVGSFCIGATITASVLPLWHLWTDARETRGRWEIIKLAGAAPYGRGAVIVALLSAFLIGFSTKTLAVPTPSDFLASYRSLDLTNGVSPLVPVTLLFIALTIVAFVHLRRLDYHKDRRPKLPCMSHDKFCPALDATVGEIENRIQKLTRHPIHYVAFSLLLIFGLYILQAPAQTLEERPLELLILLTAIFVTVFVALTWIRLILVWSAFGEFLQQLERHPLRQVFSLLPRGFMWSPVWQGGGKKRTHVAITRSLECMHALLRKKGTPHYLKEEIRIQLFGGGPASLNASVRELLKASAGRRRFSASKYRNLEKGLKKVAGFAAKYLRENKWNRGDYELRSELTTKEETKDALHASKPEYAEQEPATICGELVAFRFLAFINFVLWHIDNLVTYVSIGFLLLMVALNSYAFRSRTVIDWMLVLLFLVLTGGIVVVFAQADRDAILSRITGTEEGKLDRHFFTHLVSYGGVPALVLLSTHFPTVGRFFFSWVKPAIEAIH